jgi:hypothetical protein
MIVEQWEQELAAQAAALKAQAENVNRWDVVRRRHMRAITSLAEDVRELDVHQRELNGQLEAIEGHQNSMGRALEVRARARFSSKRWLARRSLLACASVVRVSHPLARARVSNQTSPPRPRCALLHPQSLERQMTEMLGAAAADTGAAAAVAGAYGGYAGYASAVGYGSTADAHRAEAYAKAQAVDTLLTQTSDALRSLISRVNAEYERQQGDAVCGG